MTSLSCRQLWFVLSLGGPCTLMFMKAPTDQLFFTLTRYYTVLPVPHHRLLVPAVDSLKVAVKVGLVRAAIVAELAQEGLVPKVHGEDVPPQQGLAIKHKTLAAGVLAGKLAVGMALPGVLQQQGSRFKRSLERCQGQVIASHTHKAAYRLIGCLL